MLQKMGDRIKCDPSLKFWKLIICKLNWSVLQLINSLLKQNIYLCEPNEPQSRPVNISEYIEAKKKMSRNELQLRITYEIKPGIFDEKRGNAALLIKNSGFYFISWRTPSSRRSQHRNKCQKQMSKTIFWRHKLRSASCLLVIKELAPNWTCAQLQTDCLI